MHDSRNIKEFINNEIALRVLQQASETVHRIKTIGHDVDYTLRKELHKPIFYKKWKH